MAHRSGPVSLVSEAAVASASWVATSPGIGRTRLGRARAEAQGADDPTGRDGLGQLGQPGRVLLLDAVGEGLAQLGGEGLGLVVAAGVAGRVDDRAEVAEVELVDDGGGGLGPVAPGGGGGLAPQLLGDAQEGVGLDLGLARGLQLFVLLVDGLAHGRDATGEQLLGDRALLGRHRLEEGGAMDLARAEALGLRLLLDRRGSGARRALVAALLAVAPAVAAAVAPTRAAVAPAVAATLTVAVAAAVVAPSALARAAGGQRRGDERLVGAAPRT